MCCCLPFLKFSPIKIGTNPLTPKNIDTKADDRRGSLIPLKNGSLFQSQLQEPNDFVIQDVQGIQPHPKGKSWNFHVMPELTTKQLSKNPTPSEAVENYRSDIRTCLSILKAKSRLKGIRCGKLIIIRQSKVFEVHILDVNRSYVLRETTGTLKLVKTHNFCFQIPVSLPTFSVETLKILQYVSLARVDIIKEKMSEKILRLKINSHDKMYGQDNQKMYPSVKSNLISDGYTFLTLIDKNGELKEILIAPYAGVDLYNCLSMIPPSDMERIVKNFIITILAANSHSPVYDVKPENVAIDFNKNEKITPIDLSDSSSCSPDFMLPEQILALKQYKKNNSGRLTPFIKQNQKELCWAGILFSIFDTTTPFGASVSISYGAK